MKRIEVPIGVKKKLILEFQSDYGVVNNALELKTKTDLADSIRKRAFELGGEIKEVEQVSVKQPE